MKHRLQRDSCSVCCQTPTPTQLTCDVQRGVSTGGVAGTVARHTRIHALVTLPPGHHAEEEDAPPGQHYGPGVDLQAVRVQGLPIAEPLDGGFRVARGPAGERGGAAHLHYHIRRLVDDLRRDFFSLGLGTFTREQEIREITFPFVKINTV